MAEETQIDARREQKILFAQRYFVNRNDGVMIVAKILGDEAIENPMLAINFGNSWPFDATVIEELTRLEETSKSKGRYEATAFEWAQRCFQLGDNKVAHDMLKLAATIAGHINTTKATGSDGAKGAGREQELIDVIVDPDNRREPNPGEVVAKWE